jgi:hypothetical protein
MRNHNKIINIMEKKKKCEKQWWKWEMKMKCMKKKKNGKKKLK